MRKLLSVLLAVMMVVSTVSFAAPSAVMTGFDATNAAAESAAQVTTEETAEETEEEEVQEAELLADSTEYGTLLLEIDFEKDGIDTTLDAATTGGVNVMDIASYYNEDLVVSGIHFFAGDGQSVWLKNKSLVTDTDGNTYLSGDSVDNTSSANYKHNYIRVQENSGSISWAEGTYTYMYDLKFSAALNGVTMHGHSSSTGVTELDTCAYTLDTWDTLAMQFECTENFKDIYIAPILKDLAAGGTVAIDNVKLYYKANTADITLKSTYTDKYEDVVLEDIAAGTTLTVGQFIEMAQAKGYAVEGIAETASGACLDEDTEITVNYNKTYYAVYGCDITVHTGNDDETVTVHHFSAERTGIKISEIIPRLKTLTNIDKSFKGLSTTADGTVLENWRTYNKDTDLYMLYTTLEEDTYGTLLLEIDFEKDGIDTILDAISDTNVNVMAIASYYNEDLVVSGINFFAGNGQNGWLADKSLVTDTDGNTYLSGDAVDNNNYSGTYKHNYIRIKEDSGSKDWYSGTYTYIYDLKYSAPLGSVAMHGNTKATGIIELDGCVLTLTDTWNTAAVQFECTDNFEQIYIAPLFSDLAAGGTIAIDNVRLYYKTDAARITLKTTDSNHSDIVIEDVSTTDGTTIGALLAQAKEADEDIVGIAETAKGEILSEDTVVTLDYAKTLYAVYGFDVNVLSEDGSETVKSIRVNDSRTGIKLSEIISQLTVDKTFSGLSYSQGGSIVGSTAVIKADVTLYIINTTLTHSEYGTLLLDIDFEREGIETALASAPNSGIDAMNIATHYNEDLVVSGITFFAGSGLGAWLVDKELVTDENGTYLSGDAVDNTSSAKYKHNYIRVQESSGSIDWDAGTYTYIYDIKHSAAFNGVAMHGNGLDTNVTTLDACEYARLDEWDTVAIQFECTDSFKQIYMSPILKDLAAGGTIAIDNVRLYYKTNEANITLKSTNSSYSDIVIEDVSTADGITVAELMAMADNSKLIGIAETADGEILSEDTLITLDYAKTLYAVYGFDVTLLSGSNCTIPEQTISIIDSRVGTTVGEIVKKIEGIDSKFTHLSTTSGGSKLGNSTTVTSARTYYMNCGTLDESQYGTLLFDIDFQNTDGTALTGSIYDIIGESGIANGKVNTDYVSSADVFYFSPNEGNGVLANMTLVTAEDGNVYLEADSNAGYNFVQSKVAGANGTYTYIIDMKYENAYTGLATQAETDTHKGGDNITPLVSSHGVGNVWDTIAIQLSGAAMGNFKRIFIAPKLDGGKIAVDNIRLYYKPDETIVTQEKNSIRISTNEAHQGLRFAATTTTEAAYDDTTTEYGWIITRKTLLDNAGVSTGAFTMDSEVYFKKGLNYGFDAEDDNGDGTIDEDEKRKHFSENEDTIMTTVVLTGIPEKGYNDVIVAKPYMIRNGITYYGAPWERTVVDVAKAYLDTYSEYDEDDLNGKENQDMIEYLENIVEKAQANA